jgi:hypothetical protein
MEHPAVTVRVLWLRGRRANMPRLELELETMLILLREIWRGVSWI